MSTNKAPNSIPLEKLSVIQPALFSSNAHWPYFDRLRAEDPVHLNNLPGLGRHWSVTRYNDIIKVDKNYKVFSSAGGVTILPTYADLMLSSESNKMFIASDPPRHEALRATVKPLVEKNRMPALEPSIRKRACRILDNLPIGETFDWVSTVATEYTIEMLAELFDIPFEDRHKLARWSDVATALPGSGLISSPQQRQAELGECLSYFTSYREQRSNGPPRRDFISMLAQSEASRDMEPQEFLSNLMLLLVAGNDTARNSVSGSVLGLHLYPHEWEKLQDSHALIPGLVNETIRWQTPLAYMCRTAVRDTELGGKQIAPGDRVIMWYISGNRDEDVFSAGADFLIDRTNAHQHLSFGHGIHYCMGSHLAQLQLRVLWEEILQRFKRIEVVGTPRRTFSAFVQGYTSLPVRLHAK